MFEQRNGRAPTSPDQARVPHATLFGDAGAKSWMWCPSLADTKRSMLQMRTNKAKAKAYPNHYALSVGVWTRSDCGTGFRGGCGGGRKNLEEPHRQLATRDYNMT